MSDEKLEVNDIYSYRIASGDVFSPRHFVTGLLGKTKILQIVISGIIRNTVSYTHLDVYKRQAGRIILLAGCGVNEKNIHRIASETGIREFHF